MEGIHIFFANFFFLIFNEKRNSLWFLRHSCVVSTFSECGQWTCACIKHLSKYVFFNSSIASFSVLVLYPRVLNLSLVWCVIVIWGENLWLFNKSCAFERSVTISHMIYSNTKHHNKLFNFLCCIIKKKKQRWQK